MINKVFKFLEYNLDLYKVTARRYFTTYYQDVEKVGRLTGDYYHLSEWKWVEGRHP